MDLTLTTTQRGCRTRTIINHDWGNAAPGAGRWGVWADNFSVRWTKRQYFDAGNYTFIARADDGIRVWVDGTLIIDAWKDQPLTEYRANVWLNGGEHQVKVEYYENNSGAAIQLTWQRLQNVFIPPVIR